MAPATTITAQADRERYLSRPLRPERGVDIGDVSGFLGDADMATTRKHYAPLAMARLKGASRTLSGPFSGWTAPDLVPASDDVAIASVPEAAWVH